MNNWSNLFATPSISYKKLLPFVFLLTLLAGSFINAQVTTVWEKSFQTSTRPAFFGADTERGFAYGNVGGNDRLYVVSRNGGTNVVILNAANGDSVGVLNTTGIAGGTFPLMDIGVSSDGVIFAANLTIDARTTSFKVYRWTSEAAVPDSVISFTIAGTAAIRLGDKFSVIGSTANNSLTIYAVMSAGAKYYKFTTPDGGANFSSQELTFTGITSAGTQPQIFPMPDGTFFTNGGGQNLKQVDGTQAFLGSVDGNIVPTGSNALTGFTYGGKNYLVNFMNGTAITATSSTAFFERAYILDATSGFGSTQNVGFSPFLGSSTNTNGAGDVDFKNNGDGTFTIFVLSTNNGIGAYTFNTATAIANLVPPTAPQTFAEFWPPANWRRYGGFLNASSVPTPSTGTWIPDDFANVTAPVNRAARINIYGTSIRGWFVSPTIDLGSGPQAYQAEFDVALTVYAGTGTATLGVDDTVAVVISTDNGVTWSDTNILKLWNSTTPIPNGVGEHVIISLSGYTGLVKLAVYGSSTVTNADNDFFFDNFELKNLGLAAVDWCNLQWPPTGTVTQGQSLPVYAQAWINGVTSIPGATPDLDAWIGISSTDTDPSTWTTWVPATFNVDAGNNDEFMASIGATLAPGTYYYASRFQYQSGPFRYGGLTGFWVSGQSGVLTVSPFVISSFPYNEGFESTTFPPTGWAREDLNASNTWQRSTTTPFTGLAHARYTYSSTTAADDWLFTPGLVLDAAKTYRVTYNHRIQSATYPERLKVTIGDAQNAAGVDSILFDHPNLLNITYEANSVVYQPAVSGTYYVGFQAYSIANQWNLDLDDITISEVLNVDYAVTSLFQVDGIPTPFRFETMIGPDYKKGEKFEEEFRFNSSTVAANPDVNNSKQMNVYGSSFHGNPIEGITPISLKAVVKNFGLQSPTFDLNWSIAGVNGTPVSRPGIAFDAVDTVSFGTTPIERGTFTTISSAALVGDLDTTNNSKTFLRTLVYPDSMIRVKFDNGQNVPNTFIGFGTNNLPLTAGVRFTASADMKLTNIDAFYRNETDVDSIHVRVWAAGDSVTAPGTLLYSKKFAGVNYNVPGTVGDYITLPLGNDAPAFVSGSDFWVSISYSAAIQFPLGAHNSPLTTPGRSFISADDGLTWGALVVTTERAWLLRVVGIPYTEPVPPILTIWERSAATSSLPAWLGSTTERGFTYGKTSDGTEAVNDRIYVVSRNGGTFVKILNAGTGADVGDLNTSGISGGTFALNDIGVTEDGKIIGANMITGAGDLKFYMWDNELSVPINIFTYTSTATIRFGDKITVTGNYATGTAQIWAASATTGVHDVYKWSMSGGVFNTTPVIINCSDALTSAIAAASVGPLPNGDFYWNAIGQNARKYSANGTLIGIVPNALVPTGTNAIRFIGTANNNEYIATYQYGAGTEYAKILEVPFGDPTLAVLYAVTPSLGANSAGGAGGDIAFKLNPNQTADVFVLGPNNGLGAYKTTSIVPVELSTFAAIASGKNVSLSWKTATETNNHGFEIERSTSTQSWTKIGFIKSAGTTTEPQSYTFTDQNLNSGKYSYRLKIVDLDGSFEYSSVVETEVGSPNTFALSQNYPNPFNPSTKIEYQVPFTANVQIELYNIAGEKVATLVNKELGAGFYSIDVDASTLKLASGVYIYRLLSIDAKGSRFVDTKKMVLLK